MKSTIKNKFVFLTIVSVVATTAAFAQDANLNVSADASVNAGGPAGMPPPQMMDGKPGIMGKIREIRRDFKEGMQEKKAWMMGSTTPGMATPTPWKDMRGDMQNLRADMQGMMASITANLTDAQKAAISAKLGITIAELQAKIAAGTPLPQIIGNKITKEDIMKILPPMMMNASGAASGTMMHNREYGNDDRDQKPQGFLKTFFGKIFGGKSGGGDDMPKESMERNAESMMNASGSMQVDASASADVHPDGPIGGLRNFFKRLFNF